MSGRRVCSSRPSSNGEELATYMFNPSAQQFKHGDVVWSRINGESWWPVQVVDETCVACKPKKMKNDQILVRLYGTFEHMYVEPVNCVPKMEKIFGQENSSNREVFQKFLEEDLTRMKSGCQSAATVSELKEISEISEIEKEKDEAPTGKGQTKGTIKRTMIADNSPLAGSSDSPKTAKQLKVAGSSDSPKTAKQLKGVMSEAMDAVQASELGVTKRRTRSETFKARNEGTNEIEAPNESANVSSGVSIITPFDNKDLRSYAQIEFPDAEDIKKLVAKIVKEAAEKTRNESFKGKRIECPENTEYMDSSAKKSSEIKRRKLHIPRRAKNKDNEAPHITEGATTDEAQDKTAVPLSNGASLDRIAGAEMRKAAERANNENQSNSAKGDEAKNATNGDQRGKGVEPDASRERMDNSTSTTKCLLSPRCRRVMQSLGLIAPLGSPFCCRNGLVGSLLP